MGLGPRRRGRWAGSGEHSSAVDTTPHEPFHHTWPPPRQSVRLAVPRLWTDCCTRSPDGTTCSHSALAGGSPDYGRSRMALTRLAPDPGQRGSNNVWGGTPEKRGLRAGTRCPGGQPGCARPGQARVEPKSRDRTPNDDAQSQGRASAGASGRGRAATETRVRSQAATTSSTQFGATSAHRKRGPCARFKRLGSRSILSVVSGSPRHRRAPRACPCAAAAAMAPVPPPCVHVVPLALVNMAATCAGKDAGAKL